MLCSGVESGAAGWKAQPNPLSYGGTPTPRTVKIQNREQFNRQFLHFL